MIFQHIKNLSLYGRVPSSSVLIQRCSHWERKVKVNNIDINVVQNGKGEKSLLLLPGALGSSWSDFKPQIEQLPQLLPDYTIFAWDPPGYGKSIPPRRQWGLNFFQNDAFAAVNLMKALNRPKFSVLGWSDGGITGIILAGNYKENVDKLIIWGTGAYITAEEVKALENIRDVNKWSPRMRQAMQEIYGAEGFAKLWSEWTDAVSLFYKQQNGDFCLQEVKSLEAPTFILHGCKDPMIAAEHVPYLLKHISGAKYYEFPDGKHNIHLKYANEFNKNVADFLLGRQ